MRAPAALSFLIGLLVCLLLVVDVLADEPENDGSVEIAAPFDELPMDQRTIAKSLKGSFEEIDKVLREKTNSFDLDLNIKMANELLASQAGRLRSLFASNKITSEALKLFVALPEAANMCNFKSYEILAKNALANQGKLYESITRTVVDNYAKIHASNCLFDYEENLELTMIDDELQENLAAVNDVLFGLNSTDVLIRTGSTGRNTQVQPKTELITSSIGNFKIQPSGMEKILRSIELMIKGHPNEEESFYATRDKMGNFYPPANFDKRILAKFLLEPCNRYVDSLRDFFAPARLDMFTSRERQSLVPSMEEQAAGLLVDTWAKYRVCLYLTRADFKMIRPKFERILLDKIGINPRAH